MGGTYLGTPFKHLPYYLLNTHSLLMVTIIATIEGTLSIWKVNHLKHQSTIQVFMYLLSKINQNLIKAEESYNISLWCVQHLRKDTCSVFLTCWYFSFKSRPSDSAVSYASIYKTGRIKINTIRVTLYNISFREKVETKNVATWLALITMYFVTIISNQPDLCWRRPTHRQKGVFLKYSNIFIPENQYFGLYLSYM
jgi:hypothetical protein